MRSATRGATSRGSGSWPHSSGETRTRIAPAGSGRTSRRWTSINTILFTGGAGTPSAEQGYAIGVDRVREVLSDLRDGRSRAWFGAGLLTPPPEVLARERLPAGMLVTSAQDGTSAADLRLEEVLITRVDGTRVGRRSPATAERPATRRAATSSI